MNNPISKAYEALDFIVMKGTNKAVKAYNWTTGATKLEFANDLINFGAIASSAFSLTAMPVYAGMPMCLFSLYSAHISQSVFKVMGNEERDALSNHLKNYTIEEAKNKALPFGGYSCLLVAVNSTANLIYKSQSSEKEIGQIELTIMSGCYSAAFQIMRTDNLPPRKNCISRGLEKLTDLYNSSQTKPSEA